MANLGDKLIQPEEGWRRYNDNDGLFNCKNRTFGDKPTCYEGQYSLMSTKSENYIKFSFIGTKLRYIASVNLERNRCDNIDVYIDSKLVGTFNQITTEDKVTDLILNFEIVGLEKGYHDVLITGRISNISPTKDQFIFDAIDIDEDGYLVPELSRKYQFPIRIGNESKVDAYAATMNNGEEQLLITREGGLYLTRGNGTYIQVGVSMEKFNQLEQRILALESK